MLLPVLELLLVGPPDVLLLLLLLDEDDDELVHTMRHWDELLDELELELLELEPVGNDGAMLETEFVTVETGQGPSP